MLQARLELAPGYTPDWILSPTRLPIPPLEHEPANAYNYIIINIHACQTEKFIKYSSNSLILKSKLSITSVS